MTAFAFDTETAIERIDDGRWSTMIHGDWNINDSPNGGYALSPLLRAMVVDSGVHGDPVSITTHFLRPALADTRAELTVETIRRGRRFSTVRATLYQEGKPRLEAIATLGDLGGAGELAAGTHQLNIDPPRLASPGDCVDRIEGAQGVGLRLLSRVEVRIDTAHAAPDVGTGAVVAGWIRFLDRRPPDSLSLALFADCFPPSVFNVSAQTTRVPTLELTVHVRRRPAPGWIKARFQTTEMAGNLLIEDGLLWDGTDRLVAQARQLALMSG